MSRQSRLKRGPLSLGDRPFLTEYGERCRERGQQFSRMPAGGTRLVIVSRITAGCLSLTQVLMVYIFYALIQSRLAMPSIFTIIMTSLQETVLPHGVLVPTDLSILHASKFAWPYYDFRAGVC
ncbi:hypothetical protein BDV38DRAFT_178061 [Aspergillus pseudotamarii]|uniref:Uncharacterized protein n=1 Tax=Aspergillus pseudotamarii TaxID=132259 RepID=A0A5N6SJD8_ASPPS|nr:uncharacterized protein BDV38DRAFT_178061 [Aspergillus pseudotamarii]KAE8133870.1 hypothetical protein BDV38DRAFT_178061 [Aspergillus pseudotamarii]